ncbi:GTP cyclohydrolase II [Candidatus Uhrbacteria bacterium]|nr:GTP cyclohydrolase II [Candidatus Uhrbacteria bacterium]
MQRVTNAIAAVRLGIPVLIQDDHQRENEVDIVIAAERITAHGVNTALTFARGLVCVALDQGIAQRLSLPLQQTQFSSRYNTAFTVAVDIRDGTTTGISAADRARTITALIDPARTLSDFVVPGHVFPVLAADGGVFARQGHTEAAVDLMRIAGVTPAAMMCEVLDAHGAALRGVEAITLAQAQGWPMLSVEDIREYRLQTEQLVSVHAAANLPTMFGTFEVLVYAMAGESEPIIALVQRGKNNAPWGDEALVRLNSSCLTGDVLGSLRCDCRDQLAGALTRIQDAGEGVLLYLPQEGRGIGIAEKIRAYALQEQGMDTVDANLHLGYPIDGRHYGFAAQVLKHLGLKSIRILTNNPKKIEALEQYGILILGREPLETTPTPHNINYLITKQQRLGHLLDATLRGMRT